MSRRKASGSGWWTVRDCCPPSLLLPPYIMGPHPPSISHVSATFPIGKMCARALERERRFHPSAYTRYFQFRSLYFRLVRQLASGIKHHHCCSTFYHLSSLHNTLSKRIIEATHQLKGFRSKLDSTSFPVLVFFPNSLSDRLHSIWAVVWILLFFIFSFIFYCLFVDALLTCLFDTLCV